MKEELLEHHPPGHVPVVLRARQAHGKGRLEVPFGNTPAALQEPTARAATAEDLQSSPQVPFTKE